MVNSSTIINKLNNLLLSQIIEGPEWLNELGSWIT